MKKVLALVAALLSLCIGFAAVAGALTTVVEDDVKVLKAIQPDSEIGDYFCMTPIVKGVSQAWTDNVAADLSNVEVDGERFFVVELDNQNFNFRHSYSEDPTAKGNVVGYDMLRIRTKTEQAIDAALTINETGGLQMIDRYWAVDKEGAIVATGMTYAGVKLPANFDGYVYASLTHFTFQGGAQASRDKNDAAPLVNPNNSADSIDLSDVDRGSSVWTGSGKVYFGEIALVEGSVAELSVHTAPANLNFILGDSFDTVTDASLTSNYTNAGEGNGEVLVKDTDRAVLYTSHSNSIIKIATNGFNGKELNGGEQPFALAFYVRTNNAPAQINHVIAPEAVDHSLYAQGHSYLYNMDGELVGENENSPGMVIPAGFEGYYAIARTDGNYDFAVSQLLVWVSPAAAETVADAELVIDDVGILAAEPGEPAAAPTPTPEPQQGGNDNPPSGAISLIGFAVAAVVAGAVIVRKKHN
ncbi:MAG: hypothetical protein KIG36_05505 [Eubacteriales bacterium]|nr:hypothetical protein [Eubacteriales bacterium]